jgi:hypothetical protein
MSTEILKKSKKSKKNKIANSDNNNIDKIADSLHRLYPQVDEEDIIESLRRNNYDFDRTTEYISES